LIIIIDLMKKNIKIKKKLTETLLTILAIIIMLIIVILCWFVIAWLYPDEWFAEIPRFLIDLFSERF